MAKPDPKTYPCPECGTPFTKYRSTQVVCGNYKCALANVRRKEKEKREKEERKWIKQRKEKLKSKSDLTREAQVEFNAYIRLRDADKPCISCGRFHQGQWHAGHYRTTAAAPELRFNELNCHRQCAPCNNHKSGDIINYRLNLIERIGEDKVNWLEGSHEMPNWTHDELRAIKKKYQQKTRELRKQREGEAA